MLAWYDRILHGDLGQSILLNANAPNFGAVYLMLDDFHDRRDPELAGHAIAARLQGTMQDAIPDAVINVFEAPPLDGPAGEERGR